MSDARHCTHGLDPRSCALCEPASTEAMEKEIAELRRERDEARALLQSCARVTHGLDVTDAEREQALSVLSPLVADLANARLLLDQKRRCECSDDEACAFVRERDAALARTGEESQRRVRAEQVMQDKDKAFAKECDRLIAELDAEMTKHSLTIGERDKLAAELADALKQADGYGAACAEAEARAEKAERERDEARADPAGWALHETNRADKAEYDRDRLTSELDLVRRERDEAREWLGVLRCQMHTALDVANLSDDGLVAAAKNTVAMACANIQDRLDIYESMREAEQERDRLIAELDAEMTKHSLTIGERDKLAAEIERQKGLRRREEQRTLAALADLDEVTVALRLLWEEVTDESRCTAEAGHCLSLPCKDAVRTALKGDK